MTKKERKEIRYTNRMLERMFKGYVNYRNETNEETSEKLIEKVNKKNKDMSPTDRLRRTFITNN